MPADVTMCFGGGCPIRMRCYRFRAEPAARQDAFGAAPWNPLTQRCDAFWDIAALAPSEARIRDRAYAIWLSEGRPHGRDEAHWHRARTELEAAFAATLRPPEALEPLSSTEGASPGR